MQKKEFAKKICENFFLLFFLAKLKAPNLFDLLYLEDMVLVY